MKTTFRKNILITLLLSSIIMSFSFECFGQSEEEMRTLRLFYDENELVISATRYPKPVSQVAENITVISSDDIEAMNAHTVADILDRVPGLFLSFNRDFGGYALINLQGSEPRHTLVLLDDIPWNSINEGSAETITIPVGIIERIEIIKGPASSAWGSSLGGVINIITKPAGDTKNPRGSIRASYGKSSSQDYRADLSGKAGNAGYYLYAGILDSDGLVESRSSDNEYLYSRFKLPFSKDIDAGFSIGYSNTNTGFGNFADPYINIKSNIKSFFASPSLTARIASGLNMRFSAYYFRQDFGQKSTSLGLDITGDSGDLYLGSEIKEESWGGKFQVVWEKDINTVVFGTDIEKGKYDQSINAGTFLQNFEVPAVSRFSPDNTKWAVYANDTITWDRWSLIPGIRYDYESVTGSFVSPSMGITYVTEKNIVLRGTIARGFSTPPLGSTSGGGLFVIPNPSLKSEEIWSYQAGIEFAYSCLWIKSNIFFHNIDNSITYAPAGAGAPPYNSIYINDGSVRRKGIEMELETVPVHNISFRGGASYVDIDPPNSLGSSEMHSFLIGIKYNDNGLSSQLSGYYNWYDVKYLTNASYNDFLWDFDIRKRFHIDNESSIDLFAAVHNLFNGSQYTENVNPGRWAEAGIKFRF